jgi:hypothetical protein
VIVAPFGMQPVLKGGALQIPIHKHMLSYVYFLYWVFVVLCICCSECCVFIVLCVLMFLL